MAEILLDTSVLIDAGRGLESAVATVESVKRSTPLLFHFVVAAELLVGTRDQKHLSSVQRVLNAGKLLLPVEHDLRQALTLVSRYQLSHQVGWTDALIAATCLRIGATIYTVNDKHFRVIRGLKVVRPY